MKKDLALIEEIKAITERGEELDYYFRLLEVINILPTKPPQYLTERGFQVYKGIWRVIFMRGKEFLKGGEPDQP